MQLAGRRFLSRQRNFLACFGVGLLIGIIVINIGKSILLGETLFSVIFSESGLAGC